VPGGSCSWSKEHPLAIRIKSDGIAGSYKDYFNVLWKIAKE